MKKLISMATAAILLFTGLSVIAAAPANANSNANLSSLGLRVGSNVVSLDGFSANTVSYTVETSSSQLQVYSSTAESGRPKARTCNGTALGNDDNNYCVFVPGANTYTVTVTAIDSTTKTYTITFNYTPLAAPVLSSTSTITAAQVNPSVVIQTTTMFVSSSAGNYNIDFGATGLSFGSISGVNTTAITITFTGTASAGTLTFQMPSGGRPASNTLSFAIGGGVSTPVEIAAAAAATAAAAVEAARVAEAAAAVVRAAAIATAQTALSTVLKSDKPGTLSEYRSANINITTPAALTRLNAEVLKLSAADRTDFAKIKALADKIEFDETFFSATARPSAATYASYGVTGVTDRILPTINAKVLELPAALRADVKAMQELVKVESFVDRVANTATRSSVSAAALVSRGLLVADYGRRHSVVNGLALYPEGSLNTMAKIEAAIKEQIEKVEAPKRRTAEIKARIAARKR